MSLSRSDALLGGSVGIVVAAIASALASQHVYDIQPCPWCVLLRLIFVVLGGAALLGLAWRSRVGRLTSATLALALAGCGIVASLWLHFVAAASASCNLTLADRIVGATGLDRLLPEVFAAYASCAEAKATMAGLPYEFWSLGLFAVLAVMATAVLRRPA